MPKIEIIHFDRPSLSETNEKRVTSDVDVDFLDPVIFGHQEKVLHVDMGFFLWNMHVPAPK